MRSKRAAKVMKKNGIDVTNVRGKSVQGKK